MRKTTKNFMQICRKIKDGIPFDDSLLWWILSYSAVILLVVSITFTSNSFATRVLSNVVTKANHSVLSQMRMACDNIFKSIEINSSGLINTNEVKELASSITMDSAEKNERALNVSKTVKSFSAGNLMIQECLILVKNRNLCIVDDGTYNLEVAFGVNFKDFYDDKEQWLNEMYKSSYQNGFRIIESNNKKMCFFIQMLPVYSGAENICIVTILDENKLHEELKNINNSSESNCYILDNNNKIVFSSIKDNKDVIDEEVKNGDKIKIDGRYYVINFIDSGNSMFKYAITVSDKEYAKELTTVRMIFTIGYIFLLIIGALLVTLFAKINHSHNKKIRERLLQQKKQLFRKTLAESMLQNNNKKELLLNAFRENDILTHWHCHMVMIIDNFSENEIYSINQEAFAKLFSEYMSDIAYVSDCIINSRYVALISCYETILSSSQIMERVKYLKAEKDVEFICAASEIIYDLSDVYIAYEQAQEAINTSFLTEKNEILYEELSALQNDMYEFDPKTESKIISAIKKGNAEKAKSFFNELIELNLRKGINTDLLKIMFTEILATMIKVSIQLEKYKNGDLSECFTVVSRLKRKEEIGSIRQIIEKYIEYLCKTEECSLEENDNRCEQIKEYIQNNLGNSNLSMSMIIDEFSLSRSYLSTYFKKHTGYGIAEYITLCRINCAKNLLKNSRKSANEISSEVGFASLTTFFRAFKQLENTTPNLYRKQK